MLIGCITGSDFETAKSQIDVANQFCDGVELRTDLIKTPILPLKNLAKGSVMITDVEGRIQSDGLVISTYHNYNETPENLDEILKNMAPADLYKIATMANRTTDALRMLEFVKRYQNVSGICMGPLGQVTRILAPVVDNPLTFAAIGKEAAPGQLQVQELLETYHFRRHSNRTKIYGLIGNPIDQSPSYQTHNAYFKKHNIDAVYVRMLITEEEFPLFFDLVKKLGMSGLSVTAPYKEKLFAYIDILEEETEEIGAVNTLTFDHLTYGFNTDGKGALDAIESRQLVKDKQCVILGAGGSSKAIAHEAIKRGAKVKILSRRYKNLDKIPFYDVLINTTPNPAPISLEKLQRGKIVMDINIGHENSPLMLEAKSLNCTLITGREMFERQAILQFKRWQSQV